MARAILHDELEAEDAIQQAYIQAYLHLAQFSGQSRFSTWLTRIAMHEALARLRRRRSDAVVNHDEDLMSRPGPATSVPEHLAYGAELRARVESLGK